MTQNLRWLIAALMAATVFRAQTILFLPSLEAFGGPASNAWFGPWATDAILGLLVPVMVFVFWTVRDVRAWGGLVVYNAIGVLDYSHGLLTQLLHPMPTAMASSVTVYFGIGLFMLLQLAALTLLFRRDVINRFASSSN
ncbi:MAG: hypothetical protein AAF441_09770 [Pseudomonadota bacterium]